MSQQLSSVRPHHSTNSVDMSCRSDRGGEGGQGEASRLIAPESVGPVAEILVGEAQEGTDGDEMQAEV